MQFAGAVSVWGFAILLALGSPVRADVIVFSGYYDLSPAASGGPALPDPWNGSPNTTFNGSSADLAAVASPDPDISALRILNTGATDVTLSALGLTSPAMDVLARAGLIGSVTLLPGQNYIFAVGDGSDEGLSGRTISITLNGMNFSFVDAATTLAPNGVLFGDNPQLGGGDETQPWTQDADLLRSAVPEPSSLAMFGLAVAGLIGQWRRRRSVGT